MTIKKQILLLAMMLLPMVAGAETVEIDGIWYELVSKIKEAEVKQKPSGYYSGNVVIPASFTYEGTEYSVTSIGDGAFWNCYGLTSVTIPNSVTSIGRWAFQYCNGLTSVTIPNSVKSIEKRAFSGCSCLTSITIPSSVTSISEEAFQDCRALTSVTIPNSVTSIGERTFQGCSSLTSVTIPNSVKSIGTEAFNGCRGLTSITIPNSVKSIKWGTFDGCSNLTSVTIPDNVTSIENSAFSDCSGLTSVTIGSGVKSIASQAFASCKELTDVYCLAETVPSTNTDAFQDSYIEYATLHVPTASVEAYKAAEPWKSFKEIKSLTGEDIPEEPELKKCATPIIAFVDGKLKFSCSTEDVEYVSEIKDTDVRKFYDNEVTLSATYEISVYATRTGWTNSNMATATLIWGNATFTETTPETTSVRTVKCEVPALVTSHRGTITVQSETNSLPIAVYAADGQLYGSSIVSNGQASVSTNLQTGSIAIVKIGDKTVKVAVR